MLASSVAIVALLVVALLGPNLSVKQSAGSGEGSALRQVLYLMTLAIALAGARPWEKPARLLVLPISMLVALGWCCLSVSWSIVPAVAIRRLALTMIIIWTIFISVHGVGYYRTIVLLRAVLGVAVVTSLAVVLVFPQMGIHQVGVHGDPNLIGAWRGVFLQKNFAGAAAAVTILLFVFDPRELPRWLRVSAILLAAILLAGSQSKTSMGIGVMALIVGGSFQKYNPAYRLYFLPALAIVVVAIIFLIDWQGSGMASALLQDRQAFTGRAEIWPPLIAYVNDNPLTGAGYGSFWNIGDAREPIYDYAKGWVTLQTSGHNGYLDFLVQVGVPGLILGLVALFVAPAARLFGSSFVPRQHGALLLALLTFCLGHNFTESSLLERDIIVHVFLIFAIAQIYTVTLRRGASKLSHATSHKGR